MATSTYCRLSSSTAMFVQLEVSYPNRLKAGTNNTSMVLHGILDLKEIYSNLPALLGMLVIHHLDDSLVSPHPHHHLCFPGRCAWELITPVNYQVFSILVPHFLLPSHTHSLDQPRVSACHLLSILWVLSFVVCQPSSWD